MTIIFVLDLSTNADIRLHNLYLFPLAIIVVHSATRRAILFAYPLALTFQCVRLATSELTFTGFVSEMAVAVAASGLTIMIAQETRANFVDATLLARRDQLTGLLNRRGFNELLAREIERQRRYHGFFSMAMADLDNFKELNDSQGHHAGDRALILLTEILSKHTRSTDTIGRIGGDEFAILMPGTQTDDCRVVCQKLVDEIARRMAGAGSHVTASIGFAYFETAPETPSDALQKVDRAMYLAKSKGKSRVESLPVKGVMGV